MSGIGENKQGLRVLICGSIVQLFLGILYVWSVFVRPVSEFYQWDIESVKLTTSFMLCFFVIGIQVGGKLQTKTGTDKMVLAGGLMLALGMLASAFLPPAAGFLIYVTYGIIGGFGVGAGYNAIITASQTWFPKNRGFAVGVSVCAFGFATVIFAPLIEILVAQFNVKNTFIILAAGFFIVTIALFRFIRLPDSAQGGPVSVALMAKKQYTVTEAIRTKEFYFITLCMMFGAATFFILNPSFITLAIERGLDPSTGMIIVMLTGVASALGRLGAPLLSDKFGREKTAMLSGLFTMICTVLLVFVQGFPFIGAIIIIAFCYGGGSGLFPVLIVDYFGIKNVGSNFGAVMIGFAVSAFTFPVIMTFIDSMTVKFVVLAAMSAIAILLMVLLYISKKKNSL